jgi:hypothetical protein
MVRPFSSRRIASRYLVLSVLSSPITMALTSLTLHQSRETSKSKYPLTRPFFSHQEARCCHPEVRRARGYRAEQRDICCGRYHR